MRKNIAVFGGSLFQDIKLDKGKFLPTKKQSTIVLSKAYNIDNFSLEGMTSVRALQILKALPIQQLYDDCILALGEAELCNETSFRHNLMEIIEYLQENQVRPLLVSLPNELLSDVKALRIQETIDNIAVEKNIDYIYEGNTDKTVSYIVLEEEDMNKAILSLC